MPAFDGFGLGHACPHTIDHRLRISLIHAEADVVTMVILAPPPHDRGVRRANGTSTAPTGSDWLIGGGEMGQVIRAIDWSRTPLGPISDWSTSLRTTVSLLLNSNFPISVAWGPQHTQIYNDGYWPICGGKHPEAMGMDYTECWASAWPAIGGAFDSAMSGTPAFLEDQRMFLDRLGYLEETFFTFSFSPIRDDSGAIAGLFHPVTETSSKMIGQRRTAALRDLTTGTLSEQSVLDTLHLVARTLGNYKLDLPFALFYRIDDEATATLVAWTGLDPGRPAIPTTVDLTASGASTGWPLAEVLTSGSGVLFDDVQTRFPGLTCGPYPEPVGSVFVHPLTPPGRHRPVCVMVLGVSTRLPMNEAYRSFHEMVAASVTSALAGADAYHAQRRRAEALAETDRLRTTFFNNVSHEFRTPLTLLLAPLEDELEDLETGVDSLRRERLDLAHRNAIRLLGLVNTLLDFSRIENGHLQASFEPTDLAALTTDLAGSFRSVCERAHLALVVDCPPLPEPVLIDPEMWERIVLNLLSNAFKFTEQGQITISVRPAGDRVELIVEDTGTGIPADQLTQVFERFHRVPGAHGRTHEGTGIGLAFVRELVVQQSGTIEARSTLGRGSTFTVSVPQGSAHIPAEQIATERTRSQAPRWTPGNISRPIVEEAMRWLPGQRTLEAGPDAGVLDRTAIDRTARPRIIWADDNADMRQYVQRLLSGTYDVDAVVDGQAALESARRAPADLVVSDVMMPRLDGFGLLKELRTDPTTSTVPVILLSARAGEESRIEGLEAGADDYLVKPFSARELLARIQAHVQLAQLRRNADNARREAEANVAIAAIEAQLRLITDALPMLISYLDVDKRYRFANRAYSDWFGHRSEDLVGRTPIEVWGELTARLPADYIGRALAGETVKAEVWMPPLAGRPARLLRCTYLPDIGPDGVIRGCFGLGQDETERNRAETEILRLNNGLEQRVAERTTELAASNDELQAFSYSVSHDLRAPLRAIDGFARLLQDDLSAADSERYLQLVRKNAKTMGGLIDALLKLAQLGRSGLQRRPVDVRALVEQCVDDLLSERPDQQIVVDLGDLPDCEADETLLRQVWANLLSNAAKYSQPRTTSLISVGSTTEDGEVVYFCRDNGVGFDMAHADQLFKVFQRLHQADEFDGSGIGLSTVQRIVQRHGGRTWADAEIDRGATFFFVLTPPRPVPDRLRP
jgi:PAS domain S-box-containing protein